MQYWIRATLLAFSVSATACAAETELATGHDALDAICTAGPGDDELRERYGHLSYDYGGFFAGESSDEHCKCTEFAGHFYRDYMRQDLSQFENLGPASNWPDAGRVFQSVDCGSAAVGDIIYYDRDWGDDVEQRRHLSMADARAPAPNTLGKHVAVVVEIDPNTRGWEDRVVRVADSSSFADGFNVWDFHTDSAHGYRSSRGADGELGTDDDYVNWTGAGPNGRYRRYVCLRRVQRQPELVWYPGSMTPCVFEAEEVTSDIDTDDQEDEEPFDDVVPDPTDGPGGDDGPGSDRGNTGGGSPGGAPGGASPGGSSSGGSPGGGSSGGSPGRTRDCSCVSWENNYYVDEDGTAVTETYCVEYECPGTT